MHIVDIAQLSSHLPALGTNPRIIASGNFAPPLAVLGVLDATLPEFTLNMLLGQKGIPDREGVTLETSFVGPGMRKSPRLSYVPSRLSLVPRLFKTTLPPDLVVIHTTVPQDGKVSLGIETNVMVGALEAVKARGGTIIAQMNRQMPYLFGDAEIPVEDIDLAVEVDVPMPTAMPAQLDDTARAIGDAVARRVSDGATMQLGIGAVPDSVLHGLLERRGLRVWTEMFSDGVLRLDEVGALDPDAPLTVSFLFGSEQLYKWVDRNPRVRMMRTEYTNTPGNISRNPLMVSVNTALQVDLFAQHNASRIKARIFSGFGGQTDFYVGALHSPGGQAIMALRSWHPKANVSTVVPMVDEPVTSFQPTAIVTDQGVADIFGHSEKQQAANIINNAAHPSVRDELREEARALGLA
ncbi:MAG: acetyl-CoA hydrolase [Actinomycetales bacterium]|nr:acetyl-CoA hydrolase [Actinomycetales bacterium]